MKAQFLNKPRHAQSETEARYAVEGQVHFVQERDYDVHGVSVYQGTTFFLLIDDQQTPILLPSSLFEVVDPALGTDWVCRTFSGDQVTLLLGPAYFASDLKSYDEVVDQRSHKMEELWRRARANAEDNSSD